MERQLDPRPRPDFGHRRAWGLYCVREGRWIDAVFSTERAAREAIPVLSRSTSR